MLRHGSVAVCALLFAGAPVWALDGLVAKVEGPGLEEGRPGTIRATWTNTGAKPLLLQRVELVVTQGKQRWQAESRTQRAVPARSLRPLADEHVSLELIASEPMHPAAARLPLPSVKATLAGESMQAIKLLGVGRSVTLSLAVVPGAGPLSVTATASGAAHVGQAYVRGGVTTWSTSKPGTAGPGIRRDPLGARGGGAAIPIQVRLTRWIPWRSGAASELLVRTRDLQAIAVKTTHALAAQAASFSQAKAQIRANVTSVERAVRLKDGRWILQGAGRFWVVGPTGAVVDGRGSLFPLALDLAKRGKAGFLWFAGSAGTATAGLAAALKAAKFGVDRGKAWSIQVTAARLVEYLRLLSAQGVYPDARGIARTPPGPKPARELTVDAKLLPNYPAALVSLDDGKVLSLPPRKAFKGWEAKGDLWIEPDDPEIAALGKRFEGAVHPGLDTKVAAVDGAFEAVKQAPSDAKWKRRLTRAQIQAGRVFLVRSSSGKLYKVVLTLVEKQVIKLKYAPLTP